jgi:hypothetical protein
VGIGVSLTHLIGHAEGVIDSSCGAASETSSDLHTRRAHFGKSAQIDVLDVSLDEVLSVIAG